MRNAVTCVAMCQPSTSNAIELKATPAVISITIIVAAMPITIRVRRSADDESSAKSCECRKWG